jgi:hypothetical protein
MAQALPLILVGLVIAYGGVAELMIWLRSRSRLRRVTTVIVGLHESIAVNPGGRGWSPVFRFTTAEGQVVEAISSAWTFLKPTVGTRIPVTYDPVDSQRGTGRVQIFKLILAPLVIVFGVGLAIFGLTFLSIIPRAPPAGMCRGFGSTEQAVPVG